MAVYTHAEKQMFAKWRYTRDLHKNEEFWRDCMTVYKDKLTPMPLINNPQASRRFLEHLECDKCGMCCRKYDRIPVSKIDLDRIARNTEYNMSDLLAMVEDDPEKGHLVFLTKKGDGQGCPLLDRETGLCKVYDYRPDTCYFFPMQEPLKATMGAAMGGEFLQMVAKLSCPAVLRTIRFFMQEAMEGGGDLLPDLSTIPPNPYQQVALGRAKALADHGLTEAQAGGPVCTCPMDTGSTVEGARVHQPDCILTKAGAEAQAADINPVNVAAPTGEANAA